MVLSDCGQVPNIPALISFAGAANFGNLDFFKKMGVKERVVVRCRLFLIGLNSV